VVRGCGETTIAFQMADVLEVDRKKLADVVRDTFDERVRGTMGGLSETISELAQRVGGSPTSRQVALAADQRLEFSRELLSDKYSQRICPIEGAGMPIGNCHGLFSGNAVDVELIVAE